jgi:hypothetical protein
MCWLNALRGPCRLQDALEARAAAAEQQLKEANAAVDKERAGATAAVVRRAELEGVREGAKPFP